MARPLILFAHGAGAPASSPWMQAWARRLAALGRVQTFEYPYMQERRKRPDPLPKLIEAHREALAQARSGGEPVVLAGKSMGSRIGCHVALAEKVDALLCLGYPLRGASGAIRDDVLLELRAPILFMQGTRDPLCPLDMLEEVRKKMHAPSSLHVVDTGDHSLRVTKRSGIDQDAVDASLLDAIRSFLSTHLRA